MRHRKLRKRPRTNHFIKVADANRKLRRLLADLQALADACDEQQSNP